MNISFERTYNSTVIIDQDGIKFGLPPTMYIIPSRWYDTQLNDENAIEISNGANFSYRFDWRDVTFPVANDRNDLITILISDFFFKLNGGGSGLGDVVGPNSVTPNAIALFNGSTGKVIKDSEVLLSNNGLINNYSSIVLPSSTTIVDSFLANLTTAVKWTIVCENSSFDLLMQEILVWNDTPIPIFSEYGVLDKGTGLNDLIISIDINSGNMRLLIENLSITKTYAVRTSRYLL